MKAIQVLETEPGRPMVWQETADPDCGPDEAVVDIHATSVNRADLQQRAGHYPPPAGASQVLGLDMAGTICKVGAGVSDWRNGDRVCALLAGGGYAERVAVPAGMLMPLPDGWSYEYAAAVPEVFITAYLNIFIEAGFLPGETVLMHGGASGVGTAAIQLVHKSRGRILVTVGTEKKAVRCRELGADLAVNYTETDFVEPILEFTRGHGVNVIIDIVGGKYLARNLRVLGMKGRMVSLATLGGSHAELDLGAMMGRRLRLIGSVLRGRPLTEKVAIRNRFMNRFWPLMAAKKVMPVIDSVYPIQEANEAHQHMAENRNVGKIILKVA